MKSISSKTSGILGMLVLAAAMLVIGGCQIDSESSGSLTVNEGVAAKNVTAYGKVIDAVTRQGIGSATVYIKDGGTWRSTVTAASSVIGATGGAGDSTTGDFTFTGLTPNTTYPMIIANPSGGSYMQLTGTLATTDYSPNSDGINHAINQDLGQIAMEKGVTVTVRVVDGSTGTYLSYDPDGDGTNNAIPIYNGLGLGANVSVEDIVATQDSADTDKYTIVVAQTGATTLTVPALDTDGDGKYDRTAAATTITGAAQLSQESMIETVITVGALTNATAPALVASNLIAAGGSSGGAAMTMLGASDPLKLYYNMPITVQTTGEDSLTLTYPDNFKQLDAAAVTAEVTVSATTSASLLTVTPSAALTEGQTYTLNGAINSAAGGGGDTVTALATTAFTVTQTGTGTIGSTPNVTIDNFNYYTSGQTLTAPTGTVAVTNGSPDVVGTGTDFTTSLAVGDVVTIGGAFTSSVASITDDTNLTLTSNAAATAAGLAVVAYRGTITQGDEIVLAAAAPFLVFPEPVWGTVRHISTDTGTTAATTTTVVNGAPVALTAQAVTYLVKMASNDADIGFNNGGAGEPIAGSNRTGAVYRWPLLGLGIGNQADHVDSTAINSFMLGIDAYDADGNTYQTESSFNVE